MTLRVVSDTRVGDCDVNDQMGKDMITRHETVKYFVGKSLLKMFLKILKNIFENT